MPAVSKAQQRFMGMVHAADKGETPASSEVAKVSASMKDSDAKDFASTKHKGLPDHVKEAVKEIVRDVIRGEGAFGSVGGDASDGRNLWEMSQNDVHFKDIMKLYDRGGSFTKKKVGAVVCKNPKASRHDIVEELLDMDYREIVDVQDELGLKEIRERRLTEGFKHIISVDTPTQVVSKPVAAQILALAKKGVKAAEIGLKMGFVGNQKVATDAFQKVKNQIYFALDKRNESVNEVKYPTDLKVGSVILGQGFTMLKGIEGGKYYKVVSIDDTTATLTPSDKNGNTKGSSKVRHKLDSIEGGIKTAKRGDENGIVVIKESVNEEHDCGCNENHDCGCGGLHEHHHLNEDIKIDINKFLDKLNKEFPEQEYTTDFKGGKYARIVQQSRKYSGSRSAWGFVAMEDNPSKGFKKGDLLKAAGFNTPAKGARGNILDGSAKYGKWSPVYLK
jgi:hypothetical protein